MVKKGAVNSNHISSNDSKLMTFNKLMLIVVLALVAIFVVTIAISPSRNGGISLSAPTGNVVGGGFLCRFSPDFCSCRASRYCSSTTSYTIRDRSCKTTTYYCSAGQTCANGYCQAPTCTNECSTSGMRQCSGTGSFQTCGNYDSDTCLEWSSVNSCPSGQSCSSGNCYVSNSSTCTDTDGGVNYNLRGISIINTTNSNGTFTNYYTDYCQSNSYLREYYCNGNILGDQQNVFCSNGCINGACVANNQTYSLSVGKRGTGSGTITSNPFGINCGLDCNENYSSGTRVNLSATPISGSIFSGWSGSCTGTGLCNLLMNTSRVVYANFTNNTQPQSLTCFTNDGGYNIYQNGSAWGWNGTGNYNIWERCTTTTQLMENYCTNNTYTQAFVTCPSGYSCSLGKCMSTAMPDLKISSAWKFVYPTQKVVYASVNNTGNGVAGASIAKFYAQSTGEIRYVSVPSIPSGIAYTIQANFSNFTVGSLNVTADYNNSVVESNEANNGYYNPTFFN